MKRIIGVIFILSLLSFLGPVGFAHGSDGCGFGKKLADSNQDKCEVSSWNLTKFNDGFEKYSSIEIEADTDSSINAEAFNTLTLRCQKKKMHLYIFMDGYIESLDSKLSASGSLEEFGKLALKIDSGKILNWGWKRSFSSRIELNNPERLMPLLAKAKENFSFRVAREDAPSVIIYPKSDLVKFRKQFGLLGCKY